MAEIKVNDRRPFDQEGEPRDESREIPEVDPASREPPAVDFQHLVLTFYQQALIALRLLRVSQDDPSTEKQPESVPADLASAQYLISVLEVLQQKTMNNLTVVEEKFLADVLYELRMAYVHVSGG